LARGTAAFEAFVAREDARFEALARLAGRNDFFFGVDFERVLLGRFIFLAMTAS
jgi:hypothetical protein